MSKIILQEGDIAYAVINLKVAKYKCANGFHFDQQKHLVLVPYNQKMVYMEQLKPIYQIKKIFGVILNFFKISKIK